jgi:hypothetical protein
VMREGPTEQSAADAICDCFWFVANSSLTPKLRNLGHPLGMI